MNHGPIAGGRSRKALFLGLGLGVAALLVIAIAGWLYATPVSAEPAATTVVPTAEDSTPAADAGDPQSISDVIPSSGPAVSPDPNVLQMFADKDGCLSCHGDPSLIGLMTKTRPDGTTIALYVDTKGSTNSVHRYKDCTSCHGESPHETNSPLTKLSLSAKCGTCHEYEYNQWKASVHGAAELNGNTDPATCTDCHSATGNPHNIVRVLDPSATTYPKNIAQTCAKCHNDPKLMDKYGIVEKVYESYMRSFHGKAIGLAQDGAPIQQLDTATCVNCHGAHNITSVSDPKAPVAGMDNLLKTCQTCHTNAGPEFVKGFLGHKAVNSAYLPQVYWGGKAFYIFSRGMLASGVLIVTGSISLRVGPWVGRKVRRRKKKVEPEEKE